MLSYKQFIYILVSAVIAALLLGTASVFAATNTSTFTGTIASGPEFDLYQVDLAPGNIVTASTFCAPPPNNTLDSILTVFFPGNDPSSIDNADVYNDDGGSDSCGGFRDSTLSFVAPKNGTYTFRVDGFGSATGDYTLVIQVDPGTNPMLADGRINGQQAAPVILYCQKQVTHGLDTHGQVLFDVENGQSASGSWGSIAPTADGRMLLTGAFPDTKPYYFIYEGCDHGHYYALSGDPAVVFDSGDY